MSNITVNRDQVAAIAKGLAKTEMSYLQVLDVIAKATGFKNQAAMMARLSAEKPPATVETSEHRVIIAVDESVIGSVLFETPIEGGHVLIEKSFPTAAALDAYLEGVQDGGVWEVPEIAACVGGETAEESRPDFFEARRANPDLTFEDWFNHTVTLGAEDDEPDLI